MIGRIVKEGVAALQVGHELELHALGHDVGARQNVNRQALVRREQLAIGGDDAQEKSRAMLSTPDRPVRSKRVRHLARDAFEADVEKSELHAVGEPLP